MGKNINKEPTITATATILMNDNAVPTVNRLDSCISYINDMLNKNIEEVEKINRKINKNIWVHRKLSKKKNYSRWKSH